MVNKFVQNKIVPNDDNYSPRELTCFHKPWAILYSSIKKEYFNLYLLTSIFYENFDYNNYFKWYDFSGNLNNNYYKFAKEILEPRFGVKVNKNVYKSKDEFVQNICSNLENDHRVLVPVDLIELPYYEDYKIRNHIHFLIIKGFDIDKQVFYVLDNMQIDGGSDGVYKNFAMTFDSVYKIAEAIFNSILSEEDPYYWDMEYINESNYTYNYESALKLHREELLKAKENEGILSYPETDIIHRKNEKIINYARSYAKVLNFKEVYYDMLFNSLEEANIDKDEIISLLSSRKDDYAEWEKLRMSVLYNFARKSDGLLKLEGNFFKCRERDEELFEKVVKLIENIKCTGFKPDDERINKKYKLFLHNPNKAEIIYEGSAITIVHDKTKVYDTWKNKDNATQFLFNVEVKDKIEFNAVINIKNEVDFPFFSGMVLKTKEKTYLFGSDAMCSMAIYCPQDEEKFTLKKERFFGKTMSLKIILDEGYMKFYYKNLEEGEWNKWELKNNEDVIQIGLISKTWNAIEHQSDFSDIFTKVNGALIDIFQ